MRSALAATTALRAGALLAAAVGAGPHFGFGGPGRDDAWSVFAYPDGSITVCGLFQGEVDFDPGPDDAVRRAVGDVARPGADPRAVDGFLARYDTEGNLIDVTVLGGKGQQLPSGVRLGIGDDLYAVGRFEGEVDFEALDEADAADTRASRKGFDAFVAHYRGDLSLDWVRTFGDDDLALDGSGRVDGERAEAASDAVATADGGVVVVGMACGVLDLDPGPEEVTRTTRGGSRDGFVVKLDEAGRFVWGFPLGGPGMDQAQSVAVGPEGRILVSGVFSDEVDFDPGPGEAEETSAGDLDLFLAVFAPDGTFERVHTWGGPGPEWTNRGCLAADPRGGVVLGGAFSRSMHGDPRGRRHEVKSEGEQDAFVLRMKSLERLDWIAAWGGPASDGVGGIAVDPKGAVAVTGRFAGTVDFDPGRRKVLVRGRSVRHSCDPYLAVFEASGRLRWAHGFAGGLEERELNQGAGVAFLPEGRIAVVGRFHGVLDLDPSDGSAWIESAGRADAFVAVFDEDGRLVR